jgi:hypothetical protein
VPRENRGRVVQPELVQRVRDRVVALVLVPLGIERARFVGRQVAEPDRVVVDLVDALELVLDGRVEARLRVHEQLPRVDHVVGGERLAVAPRHVVAQRHGHHQAAVRAVAAESDQPVVRRRDGRGQDRVRVHLVVEADQPVEDQVGDQLAGERGRVVEAIRLVRQRDGDRSRGLGPQRARAE